MASGLVPATTIYGSVSDYILNIQNTQSSGYPVGVRASAASTDAWALIGHAIATSGQTRGVYGLSESPLGVGVYGEATATDQSGIGVVGNV